jgi:hypothetical protein
MDCEADISLMWEIHAFKLQSSNLKRRDRLENLAID